MRSGENPWRSRPTLLIPKQRVWRSLTIKENGGTSWVMIVPAPIYEWRADAHELVEEAERADPGIVLDDAVPGQLSSICENHVIADQAVVTDVRVSHDQIVAAEASDAAAFDRAAMHGAELAKLVFIAHLEPYPLARVCEILRIAADDRKREEMILAAERGRAAHNRVRLDNTAVAEFDFVSDDGEGSHLHAISEFRGGRNDCPRIDSTH